MEIPSWRDDDLIDECHVIGGYDGEDAARWQPDPAELHDVALNELEGPTVRGRMLIADGYRVIAEILREAEASPDPWVGPDQTLDPAWNDPRRRSTAAVRRDRREFAVRAAAADIAVRLGMSEAAVHARAQDAESLRERCPRVWSGFLSGAVSEPNARSAAAGARTLPDDAVQAWCAFDDQVAGSAARLTPAKFRTRVRFVRDRVHPQSIDERHAVARAERGVWIESEHDGMAALMARMPAAHAKAGYTRIDRVARHLNGLDGETRNLGQLRADVMADMLAAGTFAGTTDGTGDLGGKPGKPVVAVTVPVMTLLGIDDEPATLDGYGPIDLETARKLAGEATSWVRILTHPVTGTVLDLDRHTYRVPKALRRWLGARYPTCVFPGCARLASECEIDHVLDWHYGGRTASTNLAPECAGHHRVKHETKWRLHRQSGTDYVSWVSPSGHNADLDPPPF